MNPGEPEQAARYERRLCMCSGRLSMTWLELQHAANDGDHAATWHTLVTRFSVHRVSMTSMLHCCSHAICHMCSAVQSKGPCMYSNWSSKGCQPIFTAAIGQRIIGRAAHTS